MQAEVYDKVRVESKGVKHEGTLMPSQTNSIVLKLKNGYNIGIKQDSASITLLEKKEEKKIREPVSKPAQNKKSLPNIAFSQFF